MQDMPVPVMVIIGIIALLYGLDSIYHLVGYILLTIEFFLQLFS